MADPKRCFVIAPIGKPGTPTRDRSDKVLRFLIAPVVKELGYSEPRRADHINEPGMITAQVIERIVEDELVVVDLTGANANVYYELAIRHAIKRPFVHLIDISEPIPFDISPVRTIHVDIQDLNSVEQAKDELKRQIVAAEAAPDRIENPISMALDLKALRQSTDPVAQAIATLTAETAQLREVVASVRHDFRVLDRMRPLDEIGQALRHLEYKLDDMDFDEAKSAIDDVADKVESLGSAIDEVRDALHGMGS